MFDQAKADYAIGFIKNLKLTKGEWAGKPFPLLPWQYEEVLTPLFGTVDENGYRQYRKCYVEVPKKNGKSPLGAAIALYLLMADGEYGAEVYSAASDRDQAGIVFNIAKNMIEQEPELSAVLDTLDSTKRIIYKAKNSYYRVLSADAYSKHGYNISGCIFDELHAQPNRELYDVLTDGAGDARRQPVFFFITTAGWDRNSVCYEVHDYARRVKGWMNNENISDPIEDPHFLPVLYGLPEKEDWRDEKNWYIANPSLDHTIAIEKLRAAYHEAEHVPAKQNTFRRLRLNQWTSQNERWLPMEYWDKCNGIVDAEALRLKSCWGGVDLASCIDIAAFAKVFPDNDGFFDILMRFWIPEENMRARIERDGVPYDEWVRQGYVKATPGNYIDHKTIEKDILEDNETYHIREIAFDRWGMEYMSQNMIAEGIEALPFGQGYKSMSPPTKELLKLVLSERLRHGGNPVLWWMADNMVVETDAAENYKPNKKKSTKRIDGIVALIMAIDLATRHENDGSVYEERGFLTL